MKQPIYFGVIALILLPAAPAAAAGQPVQLHLSVEKQATLADAQGTTRVIWTPLTKTADGVHPGDILRYQVQADNTGAAPVADLVVTQPVPAGTVYVAHSANSVEAPIYSLDGKRFSAQPLQEVVGADGVTRTRPAAPEAYTALRWRFPSLPAKTTQTVTYQVRVR